MSTTSTIERTERLTLADMVVVDADVHVNDPPGALAPYCDLPWRLSLEALHGASYPYLQVPGYAPNMRLDPPEPRLPLGRYGGGDARRAERARDRHRHPLPRPHAHLRRAAEHRVRHGAGPGLQPLVDGGMAAQGAGALRRDAGHAAEPGAGGAGDRALRQRGAHHRRLPPDRGCQPALGAPHLRPDHGGG